MTVDATERGTGTTQEGEHPIATVAISHSGVAPITPK